MSATTFAGSAQFAISSILGAGGGTAAAIVAAVLLNARYAPISISVAQLFHGPRPRRLVESQLIVDESWALASRGGGRFDRRILLGAGLLLYALVGQRHGRSACSQATRSATRRSLGLDGAFPALFLALLVPQLRAPQAALAAVVGGTIALVLIPVTPAGDADRRRERRLPARAAREQVVSGVWLVVLVVGIATSAFKAAGPGAARRPGASPSRSRGLPPCWRPSCSRRWWSRRPSAGTTSSSSTRGWRVSAPERSRSRSEHPWPWSWSSQRSRPRWPGSSAEVRPAEVVHSESSTGPGRDRENRWFSAEVSLA